MREDDMTLSSFLNLFDSEIFKVHTEESEHKEPNICLVSMLDYSASSSNQTNTELFKDLKSKITVTWLDDEDLLSFDVEVTIPFENDSVNKLREAVRMFNQSTNVVPKVVVDRYSKSQEGFVLTVISSNAFILYNDSSTEEKQFYHSLFQLFLARFNSDLCRIVTSLLNMSNKLQ